jgi:hypothetical protein
MMMIVLMARMMSMPMVVVMIMPALLGLPADVHISAQTASAFFAHIN